MGKIRRLPPDLSNQIAAGEVVERPASVVKELLENALDAGATRIVVDVEGGGITLLRVSDDGAGMAAEDALLSVERHATSKIARLADLGALRSFGFRGEALPSVASVSRLRLTTREPGAAEAIEVGVDGGEPARTRPAGAAPGTTVEVRDLFFNVPARRKFLKATPTEAAHVVDVVEAISLSSPAVAFKLTKDKRVVRELFAQPSRTARVHEVLHGEPLADVTGTRGPVELTAALGRPERARAATSALRLFVNGRWVRDRALLRSVAQAYGSVLPPGRYPAGAVFVDVPAEHVDVNVHPQKSEVRFADARGVMDAVFHIVSRELARAFEMPVAVRSFAFAGGARLALPGATRTADSAPLPSLSALVPSSAPLHGAADVPSAEGAPSGRAEPSAYPLSHGTAPEVFAESATVPVSFAGLRFVAQVRGTYLLCEGEDALYLLDQHAAAERVTFHRLKRQFASRSVALQPLLLPVVVDVTAEDVALVEERADDLLAAGIDARPVAMTRIAVHAVPQIVARADPERLVRDLLAEASRGGGRAFSDAVDLALATMACHGSIRAGDRVSREEAESLLRALSEVDFGGHCPHGRPVVTRLSWAELERKVGRR